LDDSTIINELPLKYDFPIFELKLIGANSWGLTFGVAARFRSYAAGVYNDSVVFLYKIEREIITAIDLPLTVVSFGILKACSNYFISAKEGLKTFKIFHYSNLTLAKEHPTQVYPTVEQFIIQKETLIVSSITNFTIFDLKKSVEPKGIINRAFDITEPSIILVL
jgi:hypothetical protein